MRAIRLFPLVWLVGAEGFALFAPYVVLLLSAAYAVSRLRGAGDAGRATPARGDLDLADPVLA